MSTLAPVPRGTTRGFGERVVEAVKKAGSPLVLGIDPRPEEVPLDLPGVVPNASWAMRLRLWSAALVDLAAEEGLAGVKAQVAFYETGGGAGLAAFAETLDRARERGLLAIADVKRGDIGSTAEAYAAAYFGARCHFKADAVTASPLLGEDSLAPLVRAAEAESGGVFVLVRTSNPGAKDLQDLELAEAPAGWAPPPGGGKPRLSDAIAALVARLGEPTRDRSGWASVAAVVGATVPEAAARLRKAMPHTIFLAPGVGAQGASTAALAPFFDAKGEGALVPVSRGISAAWREPGAARDWREACRAAIRRFKAELAATPR